jgi:hypothetical protein
MAKDIEDCVESHMVELKKGVKDWQDERANCSNKLTCAEWQLKRVPTPIHWITNKKVEWMGWRHFWNRISHQYMPFGEKAEKRRRRRNMIKE